MPDLRTMKMMKKATMEGQRVAPVEGKHGASVALGTGADCPRTSLCHVPGPFARYTHETPREKEYGPTSQSVTMKPFQTAQPGPSHNDETVMGPYTPCSLSTGSQGSLTGSLTVPMATLTPRAHRSMARELTSLAGLSFLPSSRIETTRALGLMTPPPAPSRGRGNLAVPGPSFPPFSQHIPVLIRVIFSCQETGSPFFTGVITEATNNV